jgi:spermidine/putrescine transport system substrate-binding protein
MTATRMTRRQFLGRSGVALGGLALGPALLAACGDGGGGGGGRRLHVANWPLYIDEETVPAFRKETGIAVRYTEEINDNVEYFAKIQPLLSRGDRIDPDIIVLTGWMADRLIRLGWVQRLPLDDIPNRRNLRADLRNPVWDPTGAYSLPWQSGMTGIAYNRKEAGRDLTSVGDLFDPAFKGRIGMLSEMRDTIGLLMNYTGADQTKPTFEAAKPAFALLEKAKNEGQIRAFTGNDYQDDLVSGNIVATIGWSGDVAQLALEKPELRFVIPKEGGNVWSDVMLIPKGARNVAEAAAWMNYVYDPAHAARITASVQYVPPVEGVREELRKMGGDAARLADSPFLFPDDATLARLKAFGPLSEEEEQRFEEEFSRITGV